MSNKLPYAIHPFYLQGKTYNPLEIQKQAQTCTSFLVHAFFSRLQVDPEKKLEDLLKLDSFWKEERGKDKGLTEEAWEILLTRISTVVLGRPSVRNTERHCDPNESIKLSVSFAACKEFGDATKASKSATYKT